MATNRLLGGMYATPERGPIEGDELVLSGLTSLPSKLFKPPRVAASPVQLECRYLRTIELPSWDSDTTNAMVLGEVVGIHIDDAYVKDGRVDVGRMPPIPRLGDMDYAIVESIFHLDRSDMKKSQPHATACPRPDDRRVGKEGRRAGR